MNLPPCSRGLALATLILLHAVPADSSDRWPGFRGAGDSHSSAENLPWKWELRGRTAGNWSVRLPGYGQSSPVVWQGRVFVTAVSGAEKDRLHVLAHSLVDGKLAWEREFSGTQRVADSDTVSRAAPTPVVDPQHIYAVFESGDVMALTHSGEVVWQRSFVRDYGEVLGPHGYASSPVLVDNVLVLQVAHSGPSYVLGLDTRTGDTRWKTEHPPQTGWSSPALFRRGDDSQIIVSTSGSVRGLDARTGNELWMTSAVQGNSTASPTVAGEFLLIGASTERGGRGPAAGKSDLAPTEPAALPGSLALQLASPIRSQPPHLAWRESKISTGYASPVALDGLAYFVNRVGVAQCVDVATGKIHWQHRLPGEVWASPVANHGHITFFCKHGQVVTLQGGPELVQVAESQVSTTDVVYGVAAVDNAWIVRTGRGLTRIGGAAADRIAPSPAAQN